ncbi:COPII coat Sec23p-Sfb3p heterodimer component [Ceratobasidium sp. 392]|nr:COPII coat Sec23p-Sfb3p heterodimer component [Ceratobasidium sp. 392]
MIPTYFSSPVAGGAVLGAAIQAGLSALLPTGGQVIAFQNAHPTDLPSRAKTEQEVTNTDKERALFASGSLRWTELAEEYAEAGVGISLWLFPSQFMDIGTLGESLDHLSYA